MQGSRPSPDLPAERRLALVVATAGYRDASLRQLRAPARDAADLGELLADPAVGGFAVTTVLDRSAQEIRLAVEEFLSDRRPDDLVVVYLSCHGLVDARRRLYFAATDTQKNRLASTGVEAEWLLDQLEDCRARRQVVILDCCFSGAFGDRAKGDDDLGLDRRFHGQGRGRVVLTASRGSEYSFEGEPLADAVQPGSVFTNALVNGIRSGDADRDHDGYISVDDAYEYAFDRLREAGVAQTPQRSVYQAEGQILLARSPAGVPVDTTPLPEHLRSALDSPLPSVRLAGVQELGQLLDDATLAAQARETLAAIAKNDVPDVAIAAKALLVPPKPPTPPPAPAVRVPLRRNIPLLAGIAVAVVIALTVTLVLALRPKTTTSSPPSPPNMLAVAYSPDGKLLAASGYEPGTETIRLWNTSNWQLTKIPLDKSETRTKLAFSPDGAMLAAAGYDGVRLFDTTSHRLIGIPFGDTVVVNKQHGVTSIAFSPDKRTLAVGDVNGNIQIWDVAQRTVIAPMLSGHSGTISSLAYSPDGKVLASAGSTEWHTDNNTYTNDGTVRLWDTATHQQIGDPLINERANSAAIAVAFAPGGEKLAAGYGGLDGLIWNIGNQRVAGTFSDSTGSPNGLTYTTTGSRLAACDGNNIRIWDATTYKQFRDLKGHTDSVNAVAFAPDGNLASASQDGTVRVWNPDTEALVKQLTA
ncbi:caspase, EACC1-associated type [Kutzneria chonburiensis]|uniref:Caspase family protein n=1 Tax=Kutzneria chonburiensis TaxID=1483604 RepID=A0ABV6MPN7_9PSEU|nr:caspase family protein [Kutzneria chonburiensis]